MSNEIRDKVLEILKDSPLYIAEIEAKLHEMNIKFTRDGLRSVVWRLASGQKLAITAENKIELCRK